jgi:hypothetical protein
MGDKRVTYRVLMEGPDGKGSLGRPRRRGQDNIKVNLKKIGWEVVQ